MHDQNLVTPKWLPGTTFYTVVDQRCKISRPLTPNALSFEHSLSVHRGTRWRSYLRHYATNRKVAGSIPDSVTGIFHSRNPSGRTMALGSTQPLTEMSTRNISWGKGGRCVGLTTLTPSCADCLAVCEPQTRPVQACNGITLPYFTCPFTSLYRTVQMTMQTSYTLQMSTYLMNSCSMR